MKKVVYNLLFAIVYPFLLPGFLVRMLRRGGYAARMGDRFALYPDEVLRKFKEGGFVWIHAVSVGEVQVAGQLMREWRKVEPGVKFAFSTTSSTGWKMAEKEISERDVLMYNPLDFPNFRQERAEDRPSSRGSPHRKRDLAQLHLDGATLPHTCLSHQRARQRP